MTAVEYVARALCAEAHADEAVWEHVLTEREREAYRRRARVAVAAYQQWLATDKRGLRGDS